MTGLLNVHFDAGKHLHPLGHIVALLIGIMPIQHPVNILIPQSIEMLGHRDSIQAAFSGFGHHFLKINVTKGCFLSKLNMGMQINFHPLLLCF
ncbi:hypothetical protein D3C77_636710 [compost metagenome]